MGKTTLAIPFVTLREQPDGTFRPRYIPGRRHRALGFTGEDLRHADGSWYTIEQCVAWSRDLAARVEDLSSKSPQQRRRAHAAAIGLTVGALFELWFREPRLNGKSQIEGRKERRPLATSTVQFYRAGAARIEELDEGLIWASPARAITPRMIGDEQKGVLHRIEVARGLNVAHCVRATLSAMFGWALAKGHVSVNPAKGLTYRLPQPAARVRYGTIAEMQALIVAADALGRPDIGDSIMIGLWTGQRQADRLALVDGQITSDGIVFRQAKKGGQPLLIPEAPELAARLRAARQRRRDWRVNYPNVILDEAAHRPFLRRWYARVFADVRKAAAHGILADGTVPDAPLKPAAAARAEWRLAPTPSLADFHDQDLRDTAVTWLAIAGCTKAEIASITGHSLATVDQVLRHYLGLHPDLARSAIGKLVAWHQQQGENNG